MAPRAVSSGTITFGLVSVPVKLYSGTQSKSLHFNMLHAADNARLKQQMVCSACEAVVGRDDTLRGYEYAKGQYVVLTAEEIKALDSNSDQSIEIEEFVPIDTVDPIHFDHAYLLGADKGGAKAYRLLAQAMREAGKGAVARFSSRGKQQLVLVRESRGGLVMHTLYYADEVRDFEDIDRGEAAAVKEGELGLAMQLIDQLAGAGFVADKYEDNYRRRALELIESKVAGAEIVALPGEPPRGQIIDLMEALKASLAEGGRGAEATRRRPMAKGRSAGAKGSGRRSGATGSKSA
jgi:DNA end-binding protein Ku